jgi:hypothetical protein
LNALRWAVRLWPALEPADVTSFHTAFSFLLRYHAASASARTPFTARQSRSFRSIAISTASMVAATPSSGRALEIDPRIRNLKRVYNCIAIPREAQPPAWPPRGESEGLSFLYVGRFVRDKGLESLIKGFERALKKHPANRLATVGAQTDDSGADSAFFREMTAYVTSRGNGRQGRVSSAHFRQGKLTERVAASDVNLRAIAERRNIQHGGARRGWRKARPILVSDFGPMPEAIDHKVNGYVARAGDPESIAGAIEFFSTHRDELRASVPRPSSRLAIIFPPPSSRRSIWPISAISSPANLRLQHEQSSAARTASELRPKGSSRLAVARPDPRRHARLGVLLGRFLRVDAEALECLAPRVAAAFRSDDSRHAVRPSAGANSDSVERHLHDRACLGDRTNLYSLGVHRDRRARGDRAGSVSLHRHA